MLYSHFTLEEREYLHKKRMEHWSIRRIAESMGRSPSSISRELKRNISTDGRYRPFRADSFARTRKRKCRYVRLLPGSTEWNFIIDKLLLFWSPETIAGRWKKEHPKDKSIAYSTIYRYIYRGEFPYISKKSHLRRRGKKRNKNKGIFHTIKPDRIIPDRPKCIDNRSRIGDWEGDTITGKVGSGFITTLVDRKSRMLLAKKVSTKQADAHCEAIVEMLQNYVVKSLHFDNGSEFAAHREIENRLSTKVYFAEPHKPWQRGSNENTNGILRFFFPKGTDFTKISQEDVNYVVNLLNNRPKKCLGWRTPAEVYSKCCT